MTPASNRGIDPELADDLAIAEVVRERLEDECDGHEWVELEPDVAECSKCQTLSFKAATMDQLRRHLSPGLEGESGI